MKIETLKTLIEDTVKNDNLMAVMPGDTLALLKKINKVIDLYKADTVIDIKPISMPFDLTGIPDEVPYGQICGCNPANGGSGMCGCTMGNTMVKNPLKYGSPLTNLRFTTGTDTATNFPPGTKITNTPGGHTLTIKTTNDGK